MLIFIFIPLNEVFFRKFKPKLHFIESAVAAGVHQQGDNFRVRCALCTQLRIKSIHLSRCFNSMLIRNCDSIYRIIMTEYVTFHRIMGNAMIKWVFTTYDTVCALRSNRRLRSAYCILLFVCICFLFFALDYTVIYAQCVNKSKLPKTVKSVAHIRIVSAYV